MNYFQVGFSACDFFQNSWSQEALSMKFTLKLMTVKKKTQKKPLLFWQNSLFWLKAFNEIVLISTALFRQMPETWNNELQLNAHYQQEKGICNDITAQNADQGKFLTNCPGIFYEDHQYKANCPCMASTISCIFNTVSVVNSHKNTILI